MRAHAGYMGEGCHRWWQPFSVDIGADWVESGRAGENPQPEGKEKQAGWVESGRARETPQPEATRSSAR